MSTINSARLCHALLGLLLLCASCGLGARAAGRGLLAAPVNVAIYWGEEELDLPLAAVCADPA